jgi:hypothetical protein
MSSFLQGSPIVPPSVSKWHLQLFRTLWFQFVLFPFLFLLNLLYVKLFEEEKIERIHAQTLPDLLISATFNVLLPPGLFQNYYL